MGALRRALLTALPKVALSRLTRVGANLPLPTGLRAVLYRRFAQRYGAALDEVERPLTDYRTFAAFFARRLQPAARPLPDPAPEMAWPCDGKVVGSGALQGDCLPPIKGTTYRVAELVEDAALAATLDGGSYAIVYLAPGDYHRVHAPFSFVAERHRHIPGGLFPVNDAAVASIPRLFARNEREVLAGRLDDGRPAAVLLVAALNVGDTTITCELPGRVAVGDELGAFGLGSTVIVMVGPGGTAWPATAANTAVRCRAGAVPARTS